MTQSKIMGLSYLIQASMERRVLFSFVCSDDESCVILDFWKKNQKEYNNSKTQKLSTGSYE